MERSLAFGNASVGDRGRFSFSSGGVKGTVLLTTFFKSCQKNRPCDTFLNSRGVIPNSLRNCRLK